MPLQRQTQHASGHRDTWLDPGCTMQSSPARSALRHAAAALDAAETQHRPHAMCAALTQMGRAYRALHAPSAAQDSYTQALRWAHAGGMVDVQVDLLCELAETACALADELSSELSGELSEQRSDNMAQDGAHSAHAARERARDHAFEAAQRATSVSDALWEINVLLRISDTLNRCGDHADALGLQTRALGLMAAQAKAAS